MIAAIIQARIGSSRLPGKIMLNVCGKPLLEHLIHRIKNSKKLDKIIIATTTNKEDNEVVDFCSSRNIAFFRGSQNDVLSRYYETAKFFSVDTIVRLTADTPLLDSQTIDKTIQVYEENNFDFVSNSSPLPRTYPDGFNVEIFSFEVLEKIHKDAINPSDREHVTTYITMQPKKFNVYRVDYFKDLSKYRFNLDYKEDYQLIKCIFEEFYESKPDFLLEDVINWLDKHPEILKLNSDTKPYQNILKSFENDSKMGYSKHDDNFYLN